MIPINSNLKIAKKDNAFFATYATLVLFDGQLIYNEDTGDLFIGDGVTQLSALTAINGSLPAGVLFNTDIGVTVQGYDANTTILGNSTTGTGALVRATSPTFLTDITTPAINGVSSLLTLNNRTSILEGVSDIRIGERSSGNACIWFNQTPSVSNFALGGSSTGVTILNGSGTNGGIDIRSLGSNILILKGATTSGINYNFDFIGLSKTGQTASDSNFLRLTPNVTEFETGATIPFVRTNYFRAASYTATTATQTITNLVNGFFEAPVASTNVTATNAWSIYSEGRTKLLGYTNIGNAANTGGSLSGLRVGVGSSFLDLGEHSAGNASIWFMQATPTGSNYSFLGDGTNSILNCQVGGSIFLRVANTSYLTMTSTSLTFANAFNLIFNASTGSKIGTATNQKIGFWNATPIEQPTTAVAAGTFAANTSGIANDTATFDGYTIGQVVRALRNAGLLQ
jgi:hypothetical protein